jgi:hypothetical protein
MMRGGLWVHYCRKGILWTSVAQSASDENRKTKNVWQVAEVKGLKAANFVLDYCLSAIDPCHL